jgi:hypothetical protein
MLRINPMSGERIKPRKTLYTPFEMMTLNPDVAIAAPTIPERTAWLDEVGSPKYHVIKSQTIAAVSAEITVTCVIDAACTSPAPTVFATAVPDNAPTIFSMAAINTAAFGVKTRVDTEVAIAFAVS